MARVSSLNGLTDERAALVALFLGQLPVNGRERSSMQFCESEEPPVCMLD